MSRTQVTLWFASMVLAVISFVMAVQAQREAARFKELARVGTTTIYTHGEIDRQRLWDAYYAGYKRDTLRLPEEPR